MDAHCAECLRTEDSTHLLFHPTLPGERICDDCWDVLEEAGELD